jgi:hypothetical protein
VTVHYLGPGATYWNLPDTGQPTSYDTGDYDDAMYQPADSQKSYTDNGDGTITDKRTGLMWVQDATGIGCFSGNTMSWEVALSSCVNLAYAGYDDWRLPNVKELMSLVVQDEALDTGSLPLISEPPFQNTVRNYYWTSTTKVADVSKAMCIRFNVGTAYSRDKTGSWYVRPVRGGP